jgi:luciferase family oxidoreductase group 1
MIPFSVLDLSPVVDGGSPSQSLANSADLAKHAETLGYNRVWLAEHHNMPGIASAATAVVIGHVAAATSQIRVGAGGIMLPNHAPLQIAEQFGTLNALFPGRIDLGVGRAPGSDQIAARALRRTLAGDVDRFPQDVLELMAYFEPVQEGQTLQAVPGEGQDVPVWILGSSLFGASLAAALGLPFSFASHFAPEMLDEAVELYRHRFQPSEHLDKPYIMLGISCLAADTDEEAQFLFTSQKASFWRSRTGQTRGRMQPPSADWDDRLLDGIPSASIRAAVVGGPATVKAGLERFIAKHQADELIIASSVYEHEKRKHSYSVIAEAGGLTPRAV